MIKSYRFIMHYFCCKGKCKNESGKNTDSTLRLLELISDLLDQSVAKTEKADRSRILFISYFSIFGMFVMTFFFKGSENYSTLF